MEEAFFLQNVQATLSLQDHTPLLWVHTKNKPFPTPEFFFRSPLKGWQSSLNRGKSDKKRYANSLSKLGLY